MPTASIACCSSWPWLSTQRWPPACGRPCPTRPQAKKKISRSTQKGGAQQDLVVHPRPPANYQAHPLVLAPSPTLDSTPELIDAEHSSDNSGARRQIARLQAATTPLASRSDIRHDDKPVSPVDQKSGAGYESCGGCCGAGKFSPRTSILYARCT